MLALRKSCPDGSLPILKSTGLQVFNNVMIFKVPEELRKPGETKYQLATLDPTKDDTSWLADEYVKKVFPDYPMKETIKEKCNEEKKSVVPKKSTAREETRSKDGNRNEFRYNRDRKYYQKHNKYTPVRRSYYQQPRYRLQKPPLREKRSYHAPKGPNAAADIDPWLRPAIPERIISPLVINPPSADALFLRPEPAVICPPAVPFFNQSFNSNATRTQPFSSNNTHSQSFNSNNPHAQSFNSNNTLPAPNVYVKRKKSFGLLGDRPAESASFDNSYAEYNDADNSFDDDNGFGEFNGADNSFDDHSNYQTYVHDGNNWNEAPPGGWNDSYPDFTQNTYRGNHERGRKPTRGKDVNFSEGRDWKGNRSMGNRDAGDRGSGNRGAINRNKGDRNIVNRGAMSRGMMNRGTTNRRTMNRGTRNRGAFRGNRGGCW